MVHLNLFRKYSYLLLFFLVSHSNVNAQTPKYPNVKVNDDVLVQNIMGTASTTRNIDIDKNGFIYIVFKNKTGIWVAKSVDNGQSYLPNVRVSDGGLVVPEIIVNDAGTVFVAWVDYVANVVLLSSSTDGGLSFSTPKAIGKSSVPRDRGLDASIPLTVHMASVGERLYIVTKEGEFVYFNLNGGQGDFTQIETRHIFVYAGILIDKTGRAFLLADDPELYMYRIDEEVKRLRIIKLIPPGRVYYSSYSMSDGPCGTFVFVGGNGAPFPGSKGFKIDANTGDTSAIELGLLSTGLEARVLYADAEGTLIDGYKNENNELMINISFSQGQYFETPIVVAKGETHSISRNPITDDIVVVYSSGGNIFTTVYESSLKKIELVEPVPKLSYCNGASFDLDFTLNKNFNTPKNFTVVLSDASGSFANSKEIGTIVTDSNGLVNVVLPDDLPPSESYKIKMLSESDCVESNFIAIEIGVVSVIDALPTLNLNDIYIACLDEKGIIIDGFPVIATNISVTEYNFEWKRDDAVLSNETNSSITAEIPGIYEVTVINKISNCSVSQATKIYIGEPPIVKAESVSENFARNQIVHVLAEGLGEYEYNIDNGIWQDGTEFINLSAGEHRVGARDKQGCGENYATVLVIGYPAFFTPNGDGFNETWNVFALKQQNASISIFDRYGKLLKQIETSGEGWDGTSSGNKMPTNDYWFKLEYSDINTQEPKTFVSHFTLKR